MMLAPDGRPSLSLSNDRSENEGADFTVGPWGGVFRVGNHAVVFPAHSVCDPKKATYGANQWNAPCAPLKGSITIHAEVREQAGRTWVDFSPELRFVPSANSSRWVWLFLSTPAARGATGDLSRFNIRYAPSIGGVTVDDAASDPTLRTYVDTRAGVTFRRIMHFSGYAGNARACDALVDPACAPSALMPTP
jgi:hypothetical protein